MIYPKFLKPGDTIGICAPSAGINKEDLSFDKSISNLKKEGYNIVETSNVRSGLLPSADAKTRAKEFNELFKDDSIDFIYTATGGDFQNEILPYIDEDIIKEKISQNKVKWYAGYSDPTSLLFYLTTKFDIATIYGTNAGSFDQTNLYRNLKDALEINKGNIVKQDSFEKCRSTEPSDEEETDGYFLKDNVFWKTPNGEVDIKGRLIGGCIDCIKMLIGTRFDYTKSFIEKYKDDGIIWYLDNFALKSEDLYYTLWQMREAGYFEYTKGIVLGRVRYGGTMLGMTYEDAVKRAIGENMPIILDADIGHVRPTFNVINGAVGHVVAKDGIGSLELFLE